MVMQSLVAVLIAGVCIGNAQHGTHHGTHQAVDEVDTAIQNIAAHYSDKLCLDLLMVDCSRHVTLGDEQICASNGITYANHCQYVHAYCEFNSLLQQVSILLHGPCPGTSVQTSSAAPGTPNTVAGTAATADPILNVFCRYADTINCSNGGVHIVCGSDGVFYINQCAYSKASCKNPSLTVLDSSKCTTTSRK